MGAVLEAALAKADAALSVGQLVVGVPDLALTRADGFDSPAQLDFAGLELRAEMLLALGDADALGLELRGDDVVVVAGLGLGRLELALELLDPGARLRQGGVAVFQLVDELLGALLGLGGSRAVALEVVQDIGELGPALDREVVDEVARVADDVVLEVGCGGSSWRPPSRIGRGGRSFSGGRRRA